MNANKPDHLELPGDGLIPFPRKIVTHSITIKAPMNIVWPWIVQLGSGRAGWYSYSSIDNGGQPSAKKILPEFQHIEVGDIIPAIPNSKDAFIVQDIQKGKAIVLVVPVKTAMEDPDTKSRMKGPLRMSWVLSLEPHAHQSYTTLISRGRVSQDWLKPSPASSPGKPILIERIYGLLAKMPWFILLPVALTGHYIMESRMLRGIKARAEKQIHDANPSFHV